MEVTGRAALKRAGLLLVLAILLAGTWLRVNDLGRIPPGLYHDEAYNGLDALGMLRGAGWPIFFEGNSGREPFFLYLQALSVWFLGLSPFTLRIGSAFIGIVTIAVFYALARRLDQQEVRSAAPGLVATAALAVSYWHLNFSRVGLRAISLPLFACLALYFFWRSRQSGKLRDSFLAGLWLGASFYTYLAARFLPFVIASFWLIEFGTMFVARSAHSEPLRRWLLKAALVVTVAAAVFAPLGYYFYSHPQALLFRVSDVALSTNGNWLQALLQNAQRVLLMFFWSGDPEWRHGIARRPLLDWVIALPSVVGVLYAAAHWRKPQTWFVSLWLVVMLLPTVLSNEAPDSLRAIGALPAMCIFIGWGAGALARAASPLLRLSGARIAVGAAAVVLVGSGFISARDYFVVWANDRHAYYDFQGDLADLAGRIVDSHTNLVLPLELYAQPTVTMLTLSHLAAARSLSALSGAEIDEIASEPTVEVIPAGLSSGGSVLVRKGSVYLLDSDATPANASAKGSGEQWVDKWGKPLAGVVPLAESDVKALLQAPPRVPVGADFGHRLSLDAYRMNSRLVPGQELDVALYWSSQAPQAQGMKVFVHLLDSQGQVVAGADEPPLREYSPGLWLPNQVMPDHYKLDVPAGLPPGKYSLEIGLYRPADGSRFPVWTRSGPVADDRLVVGPLKVAQTAGPAIPVSHTADFNFGGVIALTGLDFNPGAARQGGPVQLTLLWKSLRPVERDYTVFVHVLNDRGDIVAQADHQPQNGNYPTSIWEAGEQIRDETTLVISTESVGETLTLAVGLYDLQTGSRLPLVQMSGQSGADQATMVFRGN